MQLNAQLFTLRSVLVAMAAIQLVTAASGTLVALYFSETGASQEVAALAAAAYSAGFLVGCFLVARWIADIGYIRAFAAGAAISTASALLFSLTEAVPLLILVRFATGLATAGMFSIGDAWINESADQSSRGRILAIYAIVLGIMSVGSQVLVVAAPADLDRTFVLVSLFYCLSIVVIAATRTTPPETGSKALVRLKALRSDAPTAFFGALANGMVLTTILNVAPYRAAAQGVDTGNIALFVGTIYLGRVLVQYQLGRLSDRMDRRQVIFTTSLISTTIMLVVAVFGNGDGSALQPVEGSFAHFLILGLMLLFGGSFLTMYSMLVAHAMDRTVPVYVASSAVTMLFVWTVGGIAGPLVASAFTAVLGDMAMHWTNLVIMAGFTVFIGLRIRRVPPAARAEQASRVRVVPTSLKLAPETKR